MKLKHVLVSLAATVSLAGHAATIDWGDHTSVEIASRTVAEGLFADTINFSLGSAASLTSVTVTNNLPSWLNIVDGQVSLFERTSTPSGVDVLLGQYGFNGTTGNTAHTFAAPSAGDFYYLVQGRGTGNIGGLYVLTSSAAAVPEPQAWSLALASLLVVGVIYTRRQKR